MNIKIDNASIFYRRSRSYEDLPIDGLLMDGGIINSKNMQKNSLIRQNAIRKRLPEPYIHMNRNSSLLQREELRGNISLPFNDYQLVTENVQSGERVRKCSFDSFSTVKKFLNSFKGSNRENNQSHRKRNSSEGDIRRQVILESITCELSYSNLDNIIQSLGEHFGEQSNEPVIQLESSWMELVDKKKIQSKSEENQQAAIWELIVTEANFIGLLGILVTIFYPVLQELIKKYEHEMATVSISDVFGNVHELYRNHWTLWNECISLPMVSSKINSDPLDIDAMKDGFLSISKILGSYSDFIRSLPRMRRTIKKLQNENFLFNEYIKWTESYSRQCREGHLSIVSQPFQRITKYNLLLDRIRSLTTKKSSAIIDEMMRSVDSFVQKLNSSMTGKYTMQDVKERLVATNVTKEHFFDLTNLVDECDLQFDIMQPSIGLTERSLIHEGRLKLKEFGARPVEVQLFLCNDLVMMCRPIKDNWNRLQLYKAPIRLDKLVIKGSSKECLMLIVYNDFKMVDKVLELSGTCYEIKLWTFNCNQAKSNFLAQISGHDRGTIVCEDNSYNSSMSMLEGDYSSIEFSNCQHSSTVSSVSSIISTDSAFSQSPGNVTPVDSYNSADTVRKLKYFEDQTSPSEINIDKFSDSFPYEFPA